MLDYRRQPGQARGAFPSVGRATAIYWTVERDRANGYSLRAALARMGRNPAFGLRSYGSAQYQHRQGERFHRELAECWGDALPRLIAETMGWEKV